MWIVKLKEGGVTSQMLLKLNHLGQKIKTATEATKIAKKANPKATVVKTVPGNDKDLEQFYRDNGLI